MLGSRPADGSPLLSITWRCDDCRQPGNLAHWPFCAACGEFKKPPAPVTK